MKLSLIALLSWHLTLLEDAVIEAFSAVPAPVQHVKSRFSISEFSKHHQPRRLSRLRESSSEVDAADIWQETPENDDDESSSQHTFSKAKWKKKRYLMMNDVAGLIERGDPRAPRKAQEIIHRMEKLAEIHNDEDLRPTIQAYNLLINAISKCWRKPDAGQRAEAVLEEMQRKGVQPTVVSYTTVMDAYAQSSTRNKKAAQEAERVLFELIQQQETNPNLKINSVTCDVCLKAWAKCGTFAGAERAEDILRRLEILQNAEVRPTVHSYGTVIHAFAICNGGVEAAERAEAILDRMLAAKGTKAVRPDTVVFNSVIHALGMSNSAEAGEKAISLLEKMRELHNPKKGFDTKPDIVSYNSVLAAISHSSDMNAAPKTEQVVKEMQEAYKKSKGKTPAPNTVSFNSVLHAWSRSQLPGAAERAQAVLEFMIRNQNGEIMPDTISFTTVLNAVAKSKDPEKATKSRMLLMNLINMYEATNRRSLKPSPVTYNTVLNACAFSASDTDPDQQRQGLQVALSTFSEMTKYAKPDTVSYGNLMKCFSNLMPPGQKRNEMALQLFDQCTNEGLVGELVWNEVRRAVQTRVLRNHMGLSKGPVTSLQLKDSPRQWTSNVHGDKLAARRKNRNRKNTSQDRSKTKERAPPQRFCNISEASYQSGKDL